MRREVVEAAADLPGLGAVSKTLRGLMLCSVLAVATGGCGFDDISLQSPSPTVRDGDLAAAQPGAAISSDPDRGRVAQGLTSDAAPAGYAKLGTGPEADGRDAQRLRSLRAKRDAAQAVRRELAKLNRAKYGHDLGAAPGTGEERSGQAAGNGADGREQAAPGRDRAVRRRLIESIAQGESNGPSGQVAARSASPARSADDAAEPFNVQLMALSSRGAVDDNWRRLQVRYDDLLKGRALVVDPVALPEKGLLYRLQVGPFPGREAADRVCRSLQARGQDCFVVRS